MEQQKLTLNQLAQQLAEIVAAGEDSGSQRGISDGNVAARLRKVLTKLIDQVVLPTTARPREVASVLRLVELTCIKVPNMLSGHSVSPLLDLMQRLLPNLARSELSQVQPELKGAICRVATLMASKEPALAASIITNFSNLFLDAYASSIVFISQPGAELLVCCFQFKDKKLEVRLHGMSQCEVLLSGVASILAEVIAKYPSSAAVHLTSKTLDAALVLAASANASISAAGLELTATLVSILPLRHAQLLRVLDVGNILVASFNNNKNNRKWQVSFLSLLHACLDAAEARGEEYSKGLLVRIAKIAAQGAVGSTAAQDRYHENLCQLWLECCTRCPLAWHFSSAIGFGIFRAGSPNCQKMLQSVVQEYLSAQPREAINMAFKLASTKHKLNFATITVPASQENRREAAPCSNKRRRMTRITPQRLAFQGQQEAGDNNNNSTYADSPSNQLIEDSLLSELASNIITVGVELRSQCMDSAANTEQLLALATLANTLADSAPRHAAYLLREPLSLHLQHPLDGSNRSRALLELVRSALRIRCLLLRANPDLVVMPEDVLPSSQQLEINKALSAHLQKKGFLSPISSSIGFIGAAMLAHQLDIGEGYMDGIVHAITQALDRGEDGELLAAATLLLPVLCCLMEGVDTDALSQPTTHRGRLKSSVSSSKTQLQTMLLLLQESATAIASAGDINRIRHITNGLRFVFDYCHQPQVLAVVAVECTLGQKTSIVQESTGTATVLPPHISDWARGILEELCRSPASSNEPLVIETVAAFITKASLTQLEHAKKLVQWLLRIASSRSSIARCTLLRLAPVLYSERAIISLFHEGAHPIHSKDREVVAHKYQVDLLKIIRNQLESAVTKAATDSSKIGTVECLIELVGNVGGRSTSSTSLLLALGILTLRLANDNVYCFAAGECLLGMAALKQTGLRDLFSASPDLLQLVGTKLTSCPGLLTELSDLLELSPKTVACRLLPEALPAVVASKDEPAIDALAKAAGVDRKKLFTDWGYVVVAKSLFDGGDTTFPEKMALIEASTGLDFVSYIKLVMPKTVSEIIMQAGSAREWIKANIVPESVFERTVLSLGELSMIAKGETIDKGRPTKESISEFLADGDHVTRMLKEMGDELDSKLMNLNHASTDGDARQAIRMLRCVALLIQLTGKFVGRFLPQMMVLLARSQRVQNPKEVKLQGLQGWRLLVRALASRGEALIQLGGVIHRIVVALLPSLQDTESPLVAKLASKVVADLVTVCQQEPRFRAKLKAMPPLPAAGPEELLKVNVILQEERGQLTTEEHIELLIQSLEDESAAVRATALNELRLVLSSKRDWLLGLLGSKPTTGSNNRLLSRLMSALIKSCGPEGGTVGSAGQRACAECLGMLGAVDPARVHVPPAPLPEMANGDPELLLQLMNGQLVRLLKSADSLQALDAATFSIQEVLRAYGKYGALSVYQPTTVSSVATNRKTSRESTPAAEVNLLFNILPLEAQAIVRPYLDSKYKMSGSGRKFVNPIYGTVPNITFRRWLTLWITSMADVIKGPRAALYRAAAPVCRFDIPTALFLLPYMVADMVGSGDAESLQSVEKEIIAVLKSDTATRDDGLSVQAVFTLLDTLQRWGSEVAVQPSTYLPGGNTSTSNSSKLSSGDTSLPTSSELKERWKTVCQFVNKIPRDLLAKAAGASGAHARALQYYETYVREVRRGAYNIAAAYSASFSDDEVSFLLEVYSKLEEPDGLEGLVKLRVGGPGPDDQRLVAEKAGNWGEALSLYEHSLQHNTEQNSDARNAQNGLFPLRMGHLNCLLNMGHWQALLTQVEGLGRKPSGIRVDDSPATSQLNALATAAAWRMGRWDCLDVRLKDAESGLEFLDAGLRWEVRLGRMLRCASSQDYEGLGQELDAAKLEAMGAFSAAALESYSRAYPYLVHLHMVQEAADSIPLLTHHVGPKERERALRWADRLAITQPSLATQAPILALRRQLASLAGASVDAGLCWLEHANVCRMTGHYDAGMSAALEAATSAVPGAALERINLLHARGEPYRAVSELSALEGRMSRKEDASLAHLAKSEQEKQHAFVALQLAQWMAETGQGDREEVAAMFEKALSLRTSWETAHFKFAAFLDQTMCDAKKRQQAHAVTAAGEGNRLDRLSGKSKIKLGEDRPHLMFLSDVLKHYGESVARGHQHVYQSLPRMLTLFFEFGSSPAAAAASSSTGGTKTDASLIDVQKVKAARAVFDQMQTLVKIIPLHVWLTALPQLISRVCHAHAEVAALTKHVITKVLEGFPQQALWALACVSKSTVASRRAAANAIIQGAKKHTTSDEARRLFGESASFCEQLIRLCNHTCNNKKSFSIKQELTHLARISCLSVMVPIASQLTVDVPTGGPGIDKNWKPFGDLVTVASIANEVEVMNSLQKPKKLTIIGSDGRKYGFLAKPKDDLRKDSRMMDVAGVLNRLFLGESTSRKRGLRLKRFAVTPLSEDCGIIEWVPATRGLRNLVYEALTADGHFDAKSTHPTIKRMYESFKGPRRSVLLQSVTEILPPRFHRWFLGNFPEPAAWLSARLSFTRMTAVWSMVGHIVGLGDRHGENILIDCSSGEVVHVDFCCLFDKGLSLAEPEMVPFRLTQNIIDVFGVSGHEGGFKKCCEVTLAVLRANKEAILSVMDTFVHDPLVDWMPRLPTAGRAGSKEAEQENPHAKDAMATMAGRLSGTLLGVLSRPCMPLSVEGHAHRLITEATGQENLGKMYIWWMPWV